jgi:hypothetical protein
MFGEANLYRLILLHCMSYNLPEELSRDHKLLGIYVCVPLYSATLLYKILYQRRFSGAVSVITYTDSQRPVEKDTRIC